MKCEFCNSNDTPINRLPVRKYPWYNDIYVCNNCNHTNYFQMSKDYQIRLYPKNGYVFDYKKKNDNHRQFFKSNNSNKEYVLISWKEANNIGEKDLNDVYQNVKYAQCSVHLNDTEVIRVVPSERKYIDDFITSFSFLEPTKKFFDFKMKRLKSKMKILKDWELNICE